MKSGIFSKPALRNNLVWLFWSVFYAFAFPTYNLPFMIWFAFVPVFVFAYREPISTTVKYAFFYSLLFFALAFFWLYGFWWPGLFLVIPLYSLYFAFFFFCIALVGKRLPKARWLFVPALWIASELLRSIGFHGFLWNMLGDSQWNSPLFIQSADLFGVWGISFLILLTNSVLAELVASYLNRTTSEKPLLRNAGKIAILIALFGTNLVYGWIELRHFEEVSKKSPKEKLSLLQPNVGSHDAWWEKRWPNYDIFRNLHEQAAKQKPDMIVWPETMVKHYLWWYLENYELNQEVCKLNLLFINFPREFNTPILMTSPELIDEKCYNTAEYIDPKKQYYNIETNSFNSLTHYRFNKSKDIPHNAKIHLVPFGEWMPLYDSLPIVKKIIEIEGAGAFTPSPDFNVMQGRKSSFRVLVCYEDIYAQLARKFIKKGLNYFINVTNDGWAYKLGFTHPMWQHLAGSTLTAVSVRRPIARAANTGVTGIVDVTGKFSGNIGDYQRGVYTGEISLIDPKIESFYVQIGFLFPYVLFLIAFGAFFTALFFVRNSYEQ